MAWIANMKSLITNEEMATDVTVAEALLERHQEHRTEIDARAGTFQAFELFGQQLLQVCLNFFCQKLKLKLQNSQKSTNFVLQLFKYALHDKLFVTI